MAFEYREFPEFSWSQSRRSTFKQCPRLYYWQYYGAHNGWYEDADETARQAYRLKKITSFPEFLGSVVHDLAADTIRNVRGGGSPYTADELFLIDLFDLDKRRLERLPITRCLEKVGDARQKPVPGAIDDIA